MRGPAALVPSGEAADGAAPHAAAPRAAEADATPRNSLRSNSGSRGPMSPPDIGGSAKPNPLRGFRPVPDSRLSPPGLTGERYSISRPPGGISPGQGLDPPPVADEEDQGGQPHQRTADDPH